MAVLPVSDSKSRVRQQQTRATSPIFIRIRVWDLRVFSEVLMKTTIWFLMICDDYTALACDGLCYKTIHKWTILVRD